MSLLQGFFLFEMKNITKKFIKLTDNTRLTYIIITYAAGYEIDFYLKLR